MIYRTFGKRLFDLLITIPALIVLAVPFAILSWIVRAKLGFPVIFRQQRPGLKGRGFTMLKFRTMIDANDANGDPLPDAQRATPFGNWLRQTSLDELPELINVLKGEMSLVGPRPLLMRYLPRYTPEQMRRHDAPPGITGLAQINGRNEVPWDKKFEIDVEYVDRCSLLLDLQILIGTVRTVFLKEGVSMGKHFSSPEFLGTEAPDIAGEKSA